MPGILLRWLAVLLLFALAPARAEVPLPPLAARVTDLTGTLDATQTQGLESLLAAIERERGAQIAILLLPGTQPESIEQFGIRLAEAWKIGHQGRDDGVIIIVAKNERRMRIEVGYGLEGAIPDAVASQIIRERMVPAFKRGDFAGGLVAAVNGIASALGGQAYVPAVTTEHSDVFEIRDPSKVHLFFFTMVAAAFLNSFLGLLGSLVAAAVGGWLGYAVFDSLAAGLIGAIVVFVFSFARGGRSGGLGGWSSGGGGGGFSSGGGGFSGGGGSFGGGGSSGSW